MRASREALELVGPDAGILGLDGVDEVDAEVEVDGLVAQDVLELLADAGHLVLPEEAEHHDEAGIEEDAFHDDVEADEVAHEDLDVLGGVGREALAQMSLGEAHLEVVLGADGRDLVVHVEDLALVEGEGLHDVVEGVGVDGLLEGLAQQVLAALGLVMCLKMARTMLLPTGSRRWRRSRGCAG
jgi:hypothetical protein